MPENMSQGSEDREAMTPPSFMKEMRGFCRALGERSSEDKSSSYVRIWLAILDNILRDEESSRNEAAKLIDAVLQDSDENFSTCTHERLDSVRKYLKGETEQ